MLMPACVTKGGLKITDEFMKVCSSEHQWLARGLPSGKHTQSYGKLPFIVSFPIENGDFPLPCFIARG